MSNGDDNLYDEEMVPIVFDRPAKPPQPPKPPAPPPPPMVEEALRTAISDEVRHHGGLRLAYRRDRGQGWSFARLAS
jgi:hypothetical protein